MGFFNRKKRVSPKKLGRLLGEVLRESLAKDFKNENRLSIKKEFLEKGWNFNYPRYSFEIMRLFVRMIELTIVKNYSHSKNPQAIIENFMDSLPQEFLNKYSKLYGQYFQPGALKLDQPILAISRIAAKGYFGNNPDPEQILYFSASAKAFKQVLKSLTNEIDTK